MAILPSNQHINYYLKYIHKITSRNHYPPPSPSTYDQNHTPLLYYCSTTQIASPTPPSPASHSPTLCNHASPLMISPSPPHNSSYQTPPSSIYNHIYHIQLVTVKQILSYYGWWVIIPQILPVYPTILLIMLMPML